MAANANARRLLKIKNLLFLFEKTGYDAAIKHPANCFDNPSSRSG